MDREEAGEFVGIVEDDEEVAAGAFDFGDGVLEGIASVEIVDGGVEIFAGAVGLFDFEGV